MDSFVADRDINCEVNQLGTVATNTAETGVTGDIDICNTPFPRTAVGCVVQPCHLAIRTSVFCSQAINPVFVRPDRRA